MDEMDEQKPKRVRKRRKDTDSVKAALVVLRRTNPWVVMGIDRETEGLAMHWQALKGEQETISFITTCLLAMGIDGRPWKEKMTIATMLFQAAGRVAQRAEAEQKAELAQEKVASNGKLAEEELAREPVGEETEGPVDES